MANVLLQDLARQELQTRLRITMEGVGISITTDPNYRGQPIFLQAGLPLMLTEADLAPYFNPDHLIFQGISKRDVVQGGRLPEGLYQMCVEVLDYNLGAEVSNRTCAMAWLVLNDPPIINLPAQEEKLRAQDPQNIVFQWTPRHTGSPNAAFSTEYNFELVELWPENRDPNNAIQSTPPVYQTTTFSTTLIYGPAETPLVPGRKYAFRVRARAMTGIEELDLFKNNGYSEVFTFTYGDACIAPAVISVTAISSSRARVSWETGPVHTEFIVGYRRIGSARWREQRTFLDEIIIDGLEPEMAYEFKVAGICGSINGAETETVMATTSEAPVTNFTCGAGPGAFDLQNQDPLLTLLPGDVFKAGDVEVRAFDIQGSNGTFSGIGHAEIPWLKFAKVRVEFAGIYINSDYQMLRGAVKTIFNPDSKMVVDLDKNDELSGDEDTGEEAPDTTPEVEIAHGGEISEVTVDPETGEIVVVDEDGNETTYEQPVDEETGEKKTTKITDANGDVFTVDSGGNVSQSGSGEGNTDSEDNGNNESDEGDGASDGVSGPVVYIAYENSNYSDQDEINFVFDNENYVYTLELTGHPDEAEIDWEVYDMADQNVTAILTEGSTTTDRIYRVRMSKNYDRLRVVARYDNHNITIFLNRDRPIFELDNLLAVDNENKNRVAKEGETLYLVRKEGKSLRKVNYELKTSAENKDFWIDEPTWTTTAEGDATVNFSLMTDRRLTSHYLSEWPSENNTTVEAFGESKIIKLQLLKENRTRGKTKLPSQIDDAINKVADGFNKITKKLSDISNGTIEEANLKHDIYLEHYNLEDNSSRHYFQNRSLSIGVTGTISTGEIPIPAFSIKVPKIMTIGAYVKPGISLTIKGGGTDRKKSETDEWRYYSFDLGGSVTGSIEGGLIATVLPDVDAVKFDVKGYAASKVYGGISYKRITGVEYPNEVKLVFGTDPLILGVNATVALETVLLDMKLLDYSKEWYILDRMEFRTDPIKF